MDHFGIDVDKRESQIYSLAQGSEVVVSHAVAHAARVGAWGGRGSGSLKSRRARASRISSART